MMRLTYDPELVESAVLLAESQMAPADAREFRKDRDCIYEARDGEQREARFRSLHLLWFARLGLNRIVEDCIAEFPDVASRPMQGRVVRAVARSQEGADLVDPVDPSASRTHPMLVLRLRAAAFADGNGLRDLLRRELRHVADMLDPAFGYERRLPGSDRGPAHDNLVRRRYRVVWDVVVDGRLVRAGLLGDRARTERWHEFATTFGGLGEGCRKRFDDWFERDRPTHAALLELALMEGMAGAAAVGDSGRCPLCRFPVGALDASPERLSPAALDAIRADFPAWKMELGLCTQCLDLYEALAPTASERPGSFAPSIDENHVFERIADQRDISRRDIVKTHAHALLRNGPDDLGVDLDRNAPNLELDFQEGSGRQRVGALDRCADDADVPDPSGAEIARVSPGIESVIEASPLPPVLRFASHDAAPCRIEPSAEVGRAK